MKIKTSMAAASALHGACNMKHYASTLRNLLSRCPSSAIYSFALACICSYSQKAIGAVIVDVYQQGNDVIFDVSGGSLDLTGWTFVHDAVDISAINPSQPAFNVGSSFPLGTLTALYVRSALSVSSPSSFGSGIYRNADSGTGGIIGIGWGGQTDPYIYMDVPLGYTSGTSILPASSIYANSSPLSLGITSGTYDWSWQTETGFDFIRLNVSPSPPSPVPAPLPVLGSAAALGIYRRLRSRSQRLRHAAGSRLA